MPSCVASSDAGSPRPARAGLDEESIEAIFRDAVRSSKLEIVA
jgi:hypothetical protein